MKRWLLPVLIAASAGFSMTTMYSVEPIDMANSAFVKSATQEVIAVADTVSASDVFIGAPQNTGDWIVTVMDDQQHSSVATVAAKDSLNYSFVHFVFPTPLPVRKGSRLTLTVNHSDWQHVPPVLTEVFWDPNPDAYQYGKLYLDGIEHAGALAARVYGLNRVITSDFFGVCGQMSGQTSALDFEAMPG